MACNSCHVGDTYSGGSDFENGDSFDEESILRYYLAEDSIIKKYYLS